MRKIASRCFIAITSLGMNQIDFSEVSTFYKAFDFDSNIELLVYPNRDEKVWNTDEHWKAQCFWRKQICRAVQLADILIMVYDEMILTSRCSWRRGSVVLWLFGVVAGFGLSLRFARGQASVFRQTPTAPELGSLGGHERLFSARGKEKCKSISENSAERWTLWYIFRFASSEDVSAI